MRIKLLTTAASIILLSIFTSSCALVGATTGAIIGHQSGKGLEGAAIGAVLGTVTGALLEDGKEKSRYKAKKYERR
ncbi:MAG TPA: glycine zipper 2TM domain-containing protein [Verrucomicrobia bacterium]|nr:glycine zipper 2TM domain-containing protein [Verrucomicrobiales bacterium]HIL53822.1 glycine zipper 2TM domain-containing protein [Verrucomicrobiota bacterium]